MLLFSGVCGILAAFTSFVRFLGLFPLCPFCACLILFGWADTVWCELIALFIVGQNLLQSFCLHFIFRAMSYTIFRCKVSDSGARQGHTLFCSKKIKINLGKAFLFPNLFRAARVYFLSAFPCLMAPSPVLLLLAP